MSAPSIYINLEDDVAQIASRLKRERAEEIVLVCPKRCFLFSDSINLRLLKKQADLMKKHIYILTMDERGQMYAKDAGFELRFLSHGRPKGMSDIHVKQAEMPEPKQAEANPIEKIVNLFKGEEAEEPEEENVAENKIQKSTPYVAAVPAVSPKIVVVDRVFPKAKEFEVQKKETVDQKTKFAALPVLLFSFLAVLVFATVILYILPSATVVISAKTESVNRDLEVSLSVSAAEADSGRLLLPAAKISQTLEVEDKFQSEGKKEVGNKASGTVRIYNFTNLPINLKAQTTTLSVGSKSYVLTENAVSIKPTLFKDEKTKEIDPDSLSPEVEIAAAEGGETYNLPAEVRLEISNKVFGSKPKLLYAKTETVISGATTRFLSIISDSDIQKSKETLTSRLLENLQHELKARSLVFPDKGYTTQIISFSTDRQSGSESPSFNAKLRATISGLAFNEQDLKKMIAERLLLALGPDKNFQDPKDKEKLLYSLKNNYETGTETASLAVHYESSLVYLVNTDGLAESLKGKKPEEAESLLKNHPEIDHIDINLTPSWQKTFPNFTRKIHLVIN